MACSFSPEALTSLASFTESLSLCLGFLARANRLSAQTGTGIDGSGSVPLAGRRVSQGVGGGGRRSGRRSSVGGRRRAVGSGGGGPGDGGANGAGWTVAVDLRKVDALLTMLKQLDDQESAGHLMGAGNQVRACFSRCLGLGACNEVHVSGGGGRGAECKQALKLFASCVGDGCQRTPQCILVFSRHNKVGIRK